VPRGADWKAQIIYIAPPLRSAGSSHFQDRRRAGDRGAGVRYRNNSSGGQNRRSRKRLCRRGEKDGLRSGGY
jgi:hypothetical protein